MKRLVVAAAAVGLWLVPMASAASAALPGNTAGSNCTATQATGTCTFVAPAAAQHAMGYISAGTGSIAPAPSTGTGPNPCAITEGAPVGPTLPTPASHTVNADGSVTVTGPGAGSLNYVAGCTYTVTAGAGALAAGTIQ